MNPIIDPAVLDEVQPGVQTQIEEEAKKQGSSASDVLEGIGDVVGSGVVDLVGGAIGAAVEGAGTVLAATGEVAASIIGGIFEGLGS